MAKGKKVFRECSPDDMAAWMAQEVRDSAKAFELRVREATQLAAEYSAGRLSEAEAIERLSKYDKRWGEALFGTSVAEGITDGGTGRANRRSQSPPHSGKRIGRFDQRKKRWGCLMLKVS